ncbi:hypothetical protein ABMA27_007756 [Loxostege sticticalis]|uniref:Uncharacterized protein n=1 Tax=Loxostege sticticalis TaxID=481309 RepID=A0ABR3HCR4_LOXSC
MNQSWWIPIDKLTYWRAGTWVRYEAKSYNLSLRIHCDQLLLTNNNKILESLNMNGKMKGIYKGDVLILILSTGPQEIRKIKFQLKLHVDQCLQKLGERFLVVSHNSSSKNAVERYRNIEDVFQNVIEECGSNKMSSSLPLPSNFSNFVKLCLLDPAFPSYVQETRKIIETEILKKT